MRLWQVLAISVAVGCCLMYYMIENVIYPAYRLELGRLDYGEHLTRRQTVTSGGHYLLKISVPLDPVNTEGSAGKVPANRVLPGSPGAFAAARFRCTIQKDSAPPLVVQIPPDAGGTGIDGRHNYIPDSVGAEIDGDHFCIYPWWGNLDAGNTLSIDVSAGRAAAGVPKLGANVFLERSYNSELGVGLFLMMATGGLLLGSIVAVGAIQVAIWVGRRPRPG